jgi:hypothetical protein
LKQTAVLDIKTVLLYFDSYVSSWFDLGQRYSTFLQNVGSDLLMKRTVTLFRFVIVQSGGNLMTFA